MTAKKLVRYSRDYSLLVYAATDEEAIEKADLVPEDEWGKTESHFEVDDVDDYGSPCKHPDLDDHLVCRICGECDESLNDDNVCGDCIAAGQR